MVQPKGIKSASNYILYLGQILTACDSRGGVRVARVKLAVGVYLVAAVVGAVAGGICDTGKLV